MGSLVSNSTVVFAEKMEWIVLLEIQNWKVRCCSVRYFPGVVIDFPWNNHRLKLAEN